MHHVVHSSGHAQPSSRGSSPITTGKHRSSWFTVSLPAYWTTIMTVAPDTGIMSIYSYQQVTDYNANETNKVVLQQYTNRRRFWEYQTASYNFNLFRLKCLVAWDYKNVLSMLFCTWHKKRKTTVCKMVSQWLYCHYCIASHPVYYWPF